MIQHVGELWAGEWLFLIDKEVRQVRKFFSFGNVMSVSTLIMGDNEAENHDHKLYLCIL